MMFLDLDLCGTEINHPVYIEYKVKLKKQVDSNMAEIDTLVKRLM